MKGRHRPGRVSGSIETIVHIPHSSTLIPDHTRDQFLLSEVELIRERVLMTDWYTDEIFGGMDGARDARFPVSRLVVDPERFEKDADETMSRLGMGAIYRSTSSLGLLRRPLNQSERQFLMDRYYRPHHELLASLTRQAIQRHGRCLILDGHSFPRSPLPYESDQSLERPEVCIGTDDYHTPGFLREAAVEIFKKAGFNVAVNHPFSGALVPLQFYRADRRVLALMVEVRRDLYMDESTAEKSAGFDRTRHTIRTALSRLIDCAAQGSE